MGPFVREKLGLKCRAEILRNRERVRINVFLFRSDHPVKQIPTLGRPMYVACSPAPRRLLFFRVFCYQPCAKWFLGLLEPGACSLCSRIKVSSGVPLRCSEACEDQPTDLGPRRKDTTVGCGSSYASYPLICLGRNASRRSAAWIDDT